MKISKHHSPLPTLTACFGLIGWSLAADSLDRTILPIPQPKRPVITETDARNAKAPERFHVTAPQGAPNVVIILLDDLGFGATSTFGGPIATPTLDRLAKGGLRYNQFHTTALCSPTRTALKAGRPSHLQHGFHHRNGDRISRSHR
jgi:hypothetical protein